MDMMSSATLFQTFYASWLFVTPVVEIAVLILLFIHFGLLTRTSLLARRSASQIVVLDRGLDRLQGMQDECRTKLLKDPVESARDLETTSQQWMQGERISPESPVGRHLRLILFAGFQRARLHVGQLLRSSEERLAPSEAGLRLLRGGMLLVGAIGTVALFVALNRDVARQPQASSDVARFLSEASKAFVPLLAAVLAAILSWLASASVQNWFVAPTVLRLRDATLARWIPRLFPSEGQIALEEARLAAARQPQPSPEALEFSRVVHNLKESLSESSAMASSFKTAFEGMHSSVVGSADRIDSLLEELADAFAEIGKSASRWASFETEVRGFYRVTQETQSRIEGDLERSNQQIDHQNEMFRQQNATVERILGEMRDAARQLTRPVERAAQTIEEMAKDFKHDIEQMNQNLTSELLAHSNKLSHQHEKRILKDQRLFSRLAEGFGAAVTSFCESLSSHRESMEYATDEVKQRLLAIEEPFRESAERIDRIVSNSIRRSEAAIDDLRDILSSTSDQEGDSWKALLEGSSQGIRTATEELRADLKNISGHLEDIRVIQDQQSKQLSVFSSPSGDWSPRFKIWLDATFDAAESTNYGAGTETASEPLARIHTRPVSEVARVTGNSLEAEVLDAYTTGSLGEATSRPFGVKDVRWLAPGKGTPAFSTKGMGFILIELGGKSFALPERDRLVDGEFLRSVALNALYDIFGDSAFGAKPNLNIEVTKPALVRRRRRWVCDDRGVLNISSLITSDPTANERPT